MVPYDVPVLIKVSDIFSIISNRMCHMTVQIMKVHVGIWEFLKGSFRNGTHQTCIKKTLLYQSCEKMFIPVYNLGKCPKYFF